MYCGGNRNHPNLLSGLQILGDRYRCFKKGIGIGMNLPSDQEDSDYQPLDERKIYCGNFNVLPDDYDILGSNVMCIQKGVGVGKGLRRSRTKSKKKNARRLSRNRQRNFRVKKSLGKKNRSK